MADGNEKPKVDFAYLLAKYGPKSKKKKPESADDKNKKTEYLKDGFCIKFSLSRAYKQLERQEVEAAKPEGLPLYRRRRKKCVVISQPKPEKPKKEKKEKAREKLTEKTAPVSFWKQMIMSQAHKEAGKKEEESRRAASRTSSVKGTDAATDVDQRSVKSRVSSSAVQEWERRKQVRMEENKERRQKLKKLTPDVSRRQVRPMSGRSDRVIHSAFERTGSFQRTGSARSRNTEPVITLKKPKHIIGQPLRKYDEVNPDPFAEFLDVTNKNFVWPETSAVSGQMIPGGTITSKYEGETPFSKGTSLDTGFESGSDAGLSRPSSARFSELENLVSPADSPVPWEVHLPDPHAVNTESPEPSSNSKPKERVAFKTELEECDYDTLHKPTETPTPSQCKQKSVIPKQRPKSGILKQSNQTEEQGSKEAHVPQEQVQPELQTESKQSEQPEAVQQQTPQPVQQKKEKNSKEEEDLEEEGPQLRPARFLYNMCECDKVSNPGTLQKLMTKKKKVVGVINVYGCKKEEHIKKHHETLSRMSKPRRGQTVVIAIDEETKCPFCTTKPEKRIQGWLTGVDVESIHAK